MEWVVLIAIVISEFIFGLWIKSYLPSYMKKKGENLATKEDIKEVTRLTEESKQYFRQGIEQFTTDLHFKYDFYSRQYEELYCYLYAVVVQSEYVRYCINKSSDQKITFDSIPFITIAPTKHRTQKLEFKAGKPTQFTQTEESIETEASKFNFEELVNHIIENGALAERDLLKYAVSYRFADMIKEDSTFSKDSDDELNYLQIKIIESIIKTYNLLRKELKMDFCNSELETGRLDEIQ